MQPQKQPRENETKRLTALLPATPKQSQEEVLQDLKQIHLDAKEKSELRYQYYQLVIAAKQRKQQQMLVSQQKLQQQQHDELIRQANREALRTWPADELFEIVKQRAVQLCPNYVFDDDVLHVMWVLSLYFTRDDRFESEGHGSLDKSIMLGGNVGVGKTTMMQLFANNKFQCFTIVNCTTLADNFTKDGIEVITRHFNICKVNFPNINQYFQEKVGVCYNDLGKEDKPSYHYSNKCNVIDRIIYERYERKVPGFLTHYTTRFTFAELETMYTADTMSRLWQTTNMIELSGTNKRDL